MAQRAASLRYLGIKLAQAAQEVATQLASAPGSLPEALSKGVEAYRRQLTSVIFLAGAAMAPTLNPPPKGSPGAGVAGEGESLLLRLIPRPSAKTVFVDDVVAFNSPYAASSAGPSLMVRRVKAVEGDELLAGEEEEEEAESFTIPQGHCWVLADNEELAPPHVVDSRSFGPLPFSSIVGRVVYAARSPTSHGPVQNSDEALETDGPVLDAELDLQRILEGGEEEEGGVGEESSRQ